MRNLASVVTISATRPIPGKDRIQVASFKELGYEAIVGIDLKVGDIVAFIQEGSILPETKTWEFLRARSYKPSLKGFLIKPIKMFGIQSWGLTVELKDLGLPENEWKKLKPGDNLTSRLNIRKKEDDTPEAVDNSSAIVRFFRKLFLPKNLLDSTFPSHLISKSDETTIQNCPEVLENFKDSEVYVTLKLEGQSMTAIYDNKKKFYVCSRNIAFRTPNRQQLWTYAKETDLQSKLKHYCKKHHTHLAIQGELLGPGIQNNIYCFDRYNWRIYAIKNLDTHKWLSIGEMLEVCKELELSTVPLIASNIKMSKLFTTIDEAVAYAEQWFWTPGNLTGVGKWSGKKWKDYFQHEGVVVRTMDYDKDNGIGCSFKIKNIDYASQKLSEIHQNAFQLLDD